MKRKVASYVLPKVFNYLPALRFTRFVNQPVHLHMHAHVSIIRFVTCWYINTQSAENTLVCVTRTLLVAREKSLHFRY